MILDDEQVRACYYVASEVLRSRRRLGQPIPDWLRRHYTLLDAAVRVSPTRQAVAENSDCATQSANGEIVGTAEAAAILGWSTRRVQREAAQLGGTRVCGRLLFLRADIAEHAQGGY